MQKAGQGNRRRQGQGRAGFAGRASKPVSLTLWLALSLLVLVVALALLSTLWTPYDPALVAVGPRFSPPTSSHWLGTDSLGRDVLSRIMAGAQVTVLVGVVATALSALLGVPIGLVSAMRGGYVSSLMMRGSDVLLALPGLLLALVMAAALGAGTGTAMLALGIGGIPGFIRVARSASLTVLSRDFVAAARGFNHSSWWIVRTHVWPHITGLLTVHLTVTFALAVLAESGLSFLGLGPQPPTPSWGRMLAEAQPYLGTHSYLVWAPALAIAVLVWAVNALGDGLRDLLDPREEA